MKVGSDRGSLCKFRNARSAFRNFHVDPLSLHTFMRNKQVEFNPYIYTLTTLSKLYRFATKYPFFNTKHPVIILRVSLFAVTPSRVASTKIECQNFSYVYRSRKHWECKYYVMNEMWWDLHSMLVSEWKHKSYSSILILHKAIIKSATQKSRHYYINHLRQKKVVVWLVFIRFVASCMCLLTIASSYTNKSWL